VGVEVGAREGVKVGDGKYCPTSACHNNAQTHGRDAQDDPKKRPGAWFAVIDWTHDAVIKDRRRTFLIVVVEDVGVVFH
jgi:hypothetical protein